MIRKLDHYNMLTSRLDETVQFYTEVLGLTNGPMMGSQKLGAWLYDTDGRPVVHLVGIDPDDPEEALDRTRDRLGPLAGSLEPHDLQGSGAIDHVAFECSGFNELRAKIVDLGLVFRESGIARLALKQIFLKDPNGVTLELNFR